MTRRIAALIAVALAAAALGACGESPEDEAHEDGERIGEAVRDLYDAETPEEASTAADELTAAGSELREDARDRVQTEVGVQADTLAVAAEAFRTGQSATSSGDVDAARTELQSAIQDVRAQADSFGSQDDSITNAFWRGFQDGFDDD